MYYEMTEAETVANLIQYAGGFVAGAYSDKISSVRKSGEYDKIHTLRSAETASFKRSDVITTSGRFDTYENRVQISGRVFRLGYYEIEHEIKTEKDLVVKAGNPRENAFLDHVILARKKDYLTLDTLSLNLNEIVSRRSQEVPIKKNNTIYITSNKVEENLGDFPISGLVTKSDSYKFAVIHSYSPTYGSIENPYPFFDCLSYISSQLLLDFKKGLSLDIKIT